MPKSDTPRPKILLVDDSRSTRVFVQLTLEPEFEVIVEDNPLLVPSRVASHKPTLVLLDVSMPVLDGDYVAKRIAARKKAWGYGAAQSLVVFYSSKSPAELDELVARGGVDGYIRKTSDPEQLRAAVRRLIGNLPGRAIGGAHK